MPDPEKKYKAVTLSSVDVCLVGAGAAGGILAEKLAQNGMSVVLLEAGPNWSKDEIKNDELELEKWLWPWSRKLGGEYPVLPFTGIGVGGTTRIYAGISMRARPNDFASRSKRGFGVDWPIGYQDLLSHYEEIEEKIGVQGSIENLPGRPVSLKDYPMGPAPLGPNGKILFQGAKSIGLNPLRSPIAINSLPYDKRPRCVQCGFCLLDCPSLAKGTIANTYIVDALNSGLELRTKTFAVDIPVDEEGQVTGVTYVHQRDGKKYHQKAKTVILTSGTVEVTRLLLNSTSPRFPKGLANGSGLVGKYFMSQVMGFVLGVFPKPVQSYKGMTSGVHVEDFYESDKNRGFLGGYTMHQFMFGPVWLSYIVPPFETEPVSWGQGLKDYMKQFERFAGILYVGEEMAQQKNTIRTDPKISDDFGAPISVLTHDSSKNDTLLRKHAEKMCAKILNAAGAEKILASLTLRHVAFQSMGTTRMGSDPEKSVVNEFCRAHDVDNLFIVSGSVFPTATPTFPTLTLQAIASRTADHIVSEWKKSGNR